MRLRNKKTGEMGDLIIDKAFLVVRTGTAWLHYSSIAELNEEWEDYEEPKTFWYMTAWGDVKEYSQDQFAIKQKIAIGNYFKTREEAERAVEKLKAFKRLKDKGFRFRWIDMQTGQIKYSFFLEKGQRVTSGDEDDLLTLFGGEE